MQQIRKGFLFLFQVQWALLWRDSCFYTLKQYFARFYKTETRQESKHNAEERMATGIEMLTKKEIEFINKLEEVEKSARILASAKRIVEAKQKLLERNAIRKRLTMTRSVLNNLQMFKNQMDDANVYTYSIGAMSDVAKQNNFSSANMENLYKSLTTAQQTFTTYVDQSEEMRTVLTDGFDKLSLQNDDDIEAELNRMLEEDAHPTQNIIVQVADQPTTLTNRLAPPQHHYGGYLDSIRAKHNPIPQT